MADDNQLRSIDLDQLAAVTGGAGSSEEVTLMLQSLLTSIQDLAQSQNSGSGNDFMPMMMMMMMMQGRQQPQVVAAPAEPSPGDGWIRVA
jgi:hypothetical protein